MTASVGLFLATGEPRALLVTQVALVLLAVVGFGALYELLRPSASARHSSSPLKMMRSRLLVVGGIAVVAALLAGGLSFYVTATDWYRVVDHAEIAALDHLADVSESEDVVIAATGHHGNPVGWWVEGYAERPTFTAVDVNFLAFPEERAQSEFAIAFFNEDLSLEESLAWLADNDARFVVVDKRGPDSGWLETDVARAFRTVDDTSNVVVLRAPDQS